MAQKKRKSIKWALKRTRLVKSVKRKITPRAIRLSIALDKARKSTSDESKWSGFSVD